MNSYNVVFFYDIWDHPQDWEHPRILMDKEDFIEIEYFSQKIPQIKNDTSPL